MVLTQVRAGRLASELASELEACEATIPRWIAQDKIDSGETDGVSISERAELTAAQARIRELEAELGEAGHGLKAPCGLLRVSPTGFFEWKFAAPTNRSIRRALLSDLIIKIWHESRQAYGKRGSLPNSQMLMEWRSKTSSCGQSCASLRFLGSRNVRDTNARTRIATAPRTWLSDSSTAMDRTSCGLTDITEHPSKGRQAVLLRDP